MLLFCLYIGVHSNNVLQHWKQFKDDAHVWRYGKSQKESPEAFIQESHRCARWCILSANISLGCYISHRTTASCMSSSDMNLRAFFNSSQMWKSHGSKSGLYEGCWKHFPLHGIQLVLNYVGHMGTGIVMQKDDIFSEFTHRVREELKAGQWGVRRSRIQFGLTAIQFSYLSTIYIRHGCTGGCGTVV